MTIIRINERNFCAFGHEIIRLTSRRPRIMKRGMLQEGRGGAGARYFFAFIASCQVDARGLILYRILINTSNEFSAFQNVYCS